MLASAVYITPEKLKIFNVYLSTGGCLYIQEGGGGVEKRFGLEEGL